MKIPCVNNHFSKCTAKQLYVNKLCARRQSGTRGLTGHKKSNVLVGSRSPKRCTFLTFSKKMWIFDWNFHTQLKCKSNIRPDLKILKRSLRLGWTFGSDWMFDKLLAWFENSNRKFNLFEHEPTSLSNIPDSISVMVNYSKIWYTPYITYGKLQ